MCPGLHSGVPGRGEPRYICTRGSPAPSGELVSFRHCSQWLLPISNPPGGWSSPGWGTRLLALWEAQRGGPASEPLWAGHVTGQPAPASSPPCWRSGGQAVRSAPGNRRRAALLLGEPVWLVLLATLSSLAPRCHGHSGVSKSGCRERHPPPSQQLLACILCNYEHTCHRPSHC